MSRLKKTGWLLLVLAGLVALTVAGDQKIENAHGAITKVSDEWYGIVPDDDPGTRYAPENLPDDFRVDGLRVIFSGTVSDIPPTGRRWGTPLELTEIHREQE